MQINPSKCPICGVDTNYTYYIEESGLKPVRWYRCQCGVIFQLDNPAGKDLFGKQLTEKMRSNYSHQCKTYAPLIEELTYGRKMLEVGHGDATFNMEAFAKRGWLTWAIDKDDRCTKLHNLFTGDFNAFDFNPPIEGLEDFVTDKIEDMKFDLIWASYVLEENSNPIEFLKKAKDSLSETGVLYLSTPDIDFLNKTGVMNFPHWDSKRNKILWSERALKRELERLGFKIIMCRRNFAKRFGSFYDIHLIAQKRYF